MCTYSAYLIADTCGLTRGARPSRPTPPPHPRRLTPPPGIHTPSSHNCLVYSIWRPTDVTEVTGSIPGLRTLCGYFLEKFPLTVHAIWQRTISCRPHTNNDVNDVRGHVVSSCAAYAHHCTSLAVVPLGCCVHLPPLGSRSG